MMQWATGGMPIEAEKSVAAFRLIAWLRNTEPGQIPKGVTFAEALAMTLGSEEIAAKCSGVHYQNLPSAIISGGGEPLGVFFPEEAKKHPPRDKPIVFMAMLKGELIKHIAKEL